MGSGLVSPWKITTALSRIRQVRAISTTDRSRSETKPWGVAVVPPAGKKVPRFTPGNVPGKRKSVFSDGYYILGGFLQT
jgi:hypothetical protein